MKPCEPLIIAEIGQSHDGSLGMMHAYIDALAEAGVDIIKFQTHIAEAESSTKEPFRVNFSYQDASRYQYWSRMTFTRQQWIEIKNHCDQRKLEFMSTPFSIAAFQLLESLKTKRYKIGSGDLNNYLLLDHVVKTGKPVFLSTGMANYQQINNVLDYLNNSNNQITLMQCTTAYPTPLEQVGLNNLQEYRQRFQLPVGLSDHSGTVYPSTIAITMGAAATENHVTFDKRMFGPDTSSSLTIEEIKSLVDFKKAFKKIQSNPIDKSNSTAYDDLNKMFGRSLAVSKSLPSGHIIEIDDLESKKPEGEGIDIKLYKNILGKKLARDMKKYEFLQTEDIK